MQAGVVFGNRAVVFAQAEQGIGELVVSSQTGRIVLNSLGEECLSQREFTLLVVIAANRESIGGMTRQACRRQHAQGYQQGHCGSVGDYREDTKNEVQHFCAS